MSTMKKSGVSGLWTREMRKLIFEKTSGSDIDVCFVFAITEKKKTL